MRVIGGLAFFAMLGAAAPPAQPSIQQMFDQTEAAVARDDSAAALAGYEAIERRLGGKAKPATLAIVRARRGLLLAKLGRWDEAVAPLRFAQVNLPAGEASLRGDRLEVAQRLGLIDERALDYAAAARSYRIAEIEAETPAARRLLLASQARATMFDDPAAALALIDKALAMQPGSDSTEAKRLDAMYRNLKGRVLLNRQRFADARIELDAAVKALGGLTTRADIFDISARNDAAIAALLVGDKDTARKYIAYTGAGTLRDVLPSPTTYDVPRCGEVPGLTPETVAVVELAVGENGEVTSAAPIYASQNGPAAIAFARAVQGWTWTPDSLARIKPFFRNLIRMELRCSTTVDRPEVAELLEPAVKAWAAGRAGWPLIEEAALRPIEERRDMSRRATALAESENAPAAVLAYYAIWEATLVTDDRFARSARRREIDVLAAAARRRAITRDPEARSALTLVQADWLLGIRDYGAAQPLLEAIVAEPGLAARDPIKVGALLRVATVRAQAGDLPGARAAYDRTGLTVQQCALMDVVPALVADNVGSNSFPAEAMGWGFEGWAQTEFDVAANGRTANVRTIMAYPPFVFSPASISILSGARFTQTYRPEGGLGCGGQRKGLRYGLPGRK